MKDKTYALLLIGCALLSFSAIVVTNLALDPQQIYWRDSNSGYTASTNDRYLRFRDYAAEPSSYQGLLFGSSRGRAIPLEELYRDLGGVRFANFTVYGGTIADHLPLLEFVLRDRHARRSHLRYVFMLLDVDEFGERPLTNRILQYTWPPELTGEGALRFWWRNLTAIQINAWRNAVDDILPRLERRVEAADTDIPRRGASANVDAAAHQPAAAPVRSAQAAPLKLIRNRRYFLQHLAMLQRFVTLCREHEIMLTVALSPVRVENASTYDATDWAAAVEDISRIAPAWDFGSPAWLSIEPKLWFDVSHFRPELGHLILDKIFFGTSPPMHEDFGVLRN